MRWTSWVAIAFACYVPCPVHAQTIDSIIGRVLDARGGAALIHGIRSLRMTGRIAFGQNGGDAVLVVEQRLPNQIREEISLPGPKVAVRAYDGKVGWVIDPFATPPGFRRLSGDELKNLMAESHFEPLVNVAMTGDQLQYVGLDTAAGGVAWKVMLTQSGTGYRDYYYVDTASALPVKWQGARPVQGATVVFESYFRDYAATRGVAFPHTIESGAQGVGGTQRQRISIDRIEANPALDPSRFAVPSDTTAGR